MNEDKPDHPKTKAHPPVVFLIAVLIGWLMGYLGPLLFDHPILSGRLPLGRGVGDLVGGIVFGVGLLLLVWPLALFMMKKENPLPETASNTFILSGPYRFSRNPIYVGMLFCAIGLGLVMSNFWIVIAGFIALSVVHVLVVLPEEAYLARRFGDEYKAYKDKVRRYL